MKKDAKNASFCDFIIHVPYLYSILLAVLDLMFIFSLSAVLSTSFLFGLDRVVFHNNITEAR